MLSGPVPLAGVGVHSGADVSICVAPHDDGIVFRPAGQGAVRATWRNVAATRLATVIEEGGARVQTVEHLMAALAALGVGAAEITIDGPELPIMDGSALPFMKALSPHVVAGPSRTAIRVLRPVMSRQRDAFAALLPWDGRRFDVGIDFPAPIIGSQRAVFDLDEEDFASLIAPARTFGPLADVEKLRAKGFAKGASLENAIAVDGDRVANPGGLRFPDEFARHKLLDAIGDLSLAEHPILGLYRSHKAGHRLNYRLLAALFSDAENFAIVA